MDTNPTRANSRDPDEALDGEELALASCDGQVLSSPSQAGKASEPRGTIREMARDFGVSIRALRFYEDRGLLHPKRDGATRLYDARERRNLKMILRGKQLGFTLAEIHDMLRSNSDALSASDARRCEDQHDLEESDVELALPPEQIIAQIGYLERQRKELDAAIIALRSAHRRLVESSRRVAIA